MFQEFTTESEIPYPIEEYILYREDNKPVVINMINNNSNIDCIVFLGNNINHQNSYCTSNVIARNLNYNVIFYKININLNSYAVRSEKDIKRDIKCISDFLGSRNTIKKGFGFSFGCAFLTYLSSICEFEKILLHNPFVSVKYLISEMQYGFIQSIFIIDTYDNYKNVESYKNEIIIVSCVDDRNIPISHSRILKGCNDNVKLIEVEGLGHEGVVHRIPLFEKYILANLVNTSQE